jgi:uncharacterized protein
MFEFSNLRSDELGLPSDKIGGFKKIDAFVTLRNISTGIAATFKVKYIVDLMCVRCLTSFTKSFSVTTHLDYIEGVDPYTKTECVELQSTDIDRVYYQGSYIDICVGIREAIILSIPVAPLCVENCRGLCSVCGTNINEQPCDCNAETVGPFNPRDNRKNSPQRHVKKKQKR